MVPHGGTCPSYSIPANNSPPTRMTITITCDNTAAVKPVLTVQPAAKNCSSITIDMKRKPVACALQIPTLF